MEVKATQMQIFNMMTRVQAAIEGFMSTTGVRAPNLTHEQEQALLLSGLMLPVQTVGELLNLDHKLQNNDFSEAVVSA